MFCLCILVYFLCVLWFIRESDNVSFLRVPPRSFIAFLFRSRDLSLHTILMVVSQDMFYPCILRVHGKVYVTIPYIFCVYWFVLICFDFFQCQVTCSFLYFLCQVFLYFLCQVTCSYPVFLFVPMLGHVFYSCILICSCANCITVPSCLSAHLSIIEKLSCTKLHMKLVHCLFIIC